MGVRERDRRAADPPNGLGTDRWKELLKAAGIRDGQRAAVPGDQYQRLRWFVLSAEPGDDFDADELGFAREAARNCHRRRPAPPTVQYTHAVLRSALQQAVREELIVRNVARIVETPKVPHTEVRPLDRGEALLLLRAANPHRLHALWHLLVATGLRRGEVLGLTWADIDLTARQLRVRRNLRG